MRDYIHVVDLAQGHIKALQYLMKQSSDASICEAFNLGTGTGYSVLEMVNTFKRISGRDVPYKITPRRPGDVAACYADPALSHQKLGWKAERNLDEMLADTWRWQKNNPNGYS